MQQDSRSSTSTVKIDETRTDETLADPFLPELYRVVRAATEIPDVVTIDIVPVAGERAAFAAGQFNMLYVFGVGEVAISMSGDPADMSRHVHTIRDVGMVSGALTRLKEGDVLGVRGPFGTGWPVLEAEGLDVVMVSSGCGLAPLRPAIYHVLNNRERYGRVSILLGFHSPDDLLYRHEFEQWRQRLDIDLLVTVNHADRSWRGNVGGVQVQGFIKRGNFDPKETLAMVCGPEGKMRYMANSLRDAGVPEERIYFSMERNMKCAMGICGRCQFGPEFTCKDGPVLRFDRISRILAVREI
jgi:NAD(P)H-flavin reductase